MSEPKTTLCLAEGLEYSMSTFTNPNFWESFDKGLGWGVWICEKIKNEKKQ